MPDDVFRPQRRKISPEELEGDPVAPQEEVNDPLATIRQVQQAAAQEVGHETSGPLAEELPFHMSGNVPPEFRQMLRQRGPESPQRPQQKRKQRATPDAQVRVQSSDALENLLRKLSEKYNWEEFEFLSGGRFYGDKIPPVIHIRPMTGEEEQVLATPRLVRRGKAIDMIFQRCIQEPIPTEKLLSIDRTHLLIYLRGISYTPEYDVEIRCPACPAKFSTVINLNDLELNDCPSDFGEESLTGVLPSSGFRYKYRLSTGEDELDISSYRERRIAMFGDQSEDDTMLYRTAMLLQSVEGVTDKKELTVLMKRLPINDVAFLRNEINEPPFGVDTQVPMICPACNEEFKVDLPFDANFFFPRKKEEKAQA